MPETIYNEDVRFERDGQSIGVHVEEIWWDSDVNDSGDLIGIPTANIIINTDAQRPFTREERDEWHDELTDYIRESLRD